MREDDHSRKRAHTTEERPRQDIPTLAQWEIAPKLLFGYVLDVLLLLTQCTLVELILTFVKQLSWPERHLLFCATAQLQCRDIYGEFAFTENELQEIVYLHQYHTSTVLSTTVARRELTSILVSTPSERVSISHQ